MSLYLGNDTITKQYLKDLISVVREWLNYYVAERVSKFFLFGEERGDNGEHKLSLEIKTFTFDDIDLASLSGLTLDV